MNGELVTVTDEIGGNEMLGLCASILQVSESKCRNVTNPHDRLQRSTNSKNPHRPEL